MRIKLDENLPTRLAFWLAGLGNDVDTVHEEGLIGRGDEELWEVAQRSERFLVTQDMDFSDVRRTRGWGLEAGDWRLRDSEYAV
jgi:predicted nuclease of predicted toxin-antitoxin system